MVAARVEAMKPVLTSAQMAAADRHTIEVLGIPGSHLMERAATGCFDRLLPVLPAGAQVVVLVGAGNNGGDGLAIARFLLQAGIRVTTALVFPKKTFRGDALIQYEQLKSLNPHIVPAQEVLPLPPHVDWVVDAVFGTGLNRPVAGFPATIIEAVNAHLCKVLAVDIPSGLNGSQSAIPGPVIRADLTVTFQYLKMPHVLTPACEFCGRVAVHPIGISAAEGDHPAGTLWHASDFNRRPRALSSHKGNFGSLAVIGGFAGMEGAANLSALAALRFGAGKVRILTNQPGHRFHHDSVMVDRVEGHSLREYDALVIGPGLSRSQDAAHCLEALKGITCPVVWDADALYWLAHREGLFLGEQWVMTPHPGEAARLLGISSREVQDNRLDAIKKLANKFPGGWILLKGYRTLIAAPDGHIHICEPGSPALAVAGSGDVLSGMIGAGLAQGMTMEEAVIGACLRHGMAGEYWSAHHPDYSMLAEDIIEDLKRPVAAK